MSDDGVIGASYSIQYAIPKQSEAIISFRSDAEFSHTREWVIILAGYDKQVT